MTWKIHLIRLFPPILPVLFALNLSNAGTLVLQRAFVEKYKNRATIDASFIVDHAHARANPAAKDGDLHASGRSSEVGLPMVSEIMNAASGEPKKVADEIRANARTNAAESIAGAWRIWFEHPSARIQVQFQKVQPAANTNPDHCFEIHPITQYGKQLILDSLHEVEGYTPKDAETAFGAYQKLSATFQFEDDTVAITSKKVGFNYVKFIAELTGKTEPLDNNDHGDADGQVVLANVMKDEGDDVLVENVRLVFIAETQAAKELVKSHEDTTFEFWALPRVDLSAISAFIKAGGTGQLVRKLPYEMIVVAARPIEN